MASFLAALLSADDHTTLTINALQLAELLLIKLPDAYQYHFRREGVLHEIERIAAAELVSQPKSKRTSPSRTPRDSATPPVRDGASSLTRALQMHVADATAGGSKTLTPFEAQTRDSITLRARHLRETYGALDAEPAVRAKLALDGVVSLVNELSELVSADQTASADQIAAKAQDTLRKVVALFGNESETLSSFELLESGLVEGLLKFAADEGSSPRESGPQWRLRRLF